MSDASTERLTPERRAALRAMLRAMLTKATPGPLKTCGASDGCCSCGLVWSLAIDDTVARFYLKTDDHDIGLPAMVANAALHVGAVNALPALLDDSAALAAAAQAEAVTLRARAEEAEREAALAKDERDTQQRGAIALDTEIECAIEVLEGARPTDDFKPCRSRLLDRAIKSADDLTTLRAERDAARLKSLAEVSDLLLAYRRHLLESYGGIGSEPNLDPLADRVPHRASHIARCSAAIREAKEEVPNESRWADASAEVELVRLRTALSAATTRIAALEGALGEARTFAAQHYGSLNLIARIDALLAPSPTAPRGTTELPAVQGTMCTVAECDNADAVLCCGECGVGRCAAHLDVPFDHGNKDCVPAAPKVPDAGAGREAWHDALVVAAAFNYADKWALAEAAGGPDNMKTDAWLEWRASRGVLLGAVSDHRKAVPALPAQGAPVAPSGITTAELAADLERAAPGADWLAEQMRPSGLVVCDHAPVEAHKPRWICRNPRPAPAEVAAKVHRCMRCRAEFKCPHGPACTASYDVLPNYRQADGTLVEHCPRTPALKEDDHG